MTRPERLFAAALLCAALGIAAWIAPARADDVVFSRSYSSFCLYTPWCGGVENLPVDPKYSRCRASIRLASDQVDYEAFVLLKCADRDKETFAARASSTEKKYTHWLERKNGCFEGSGFVRLAREPLGPWGFTTFLYDVELICAP